MTLFVLVRLSNT